MDSEKVYMEKTRLKYVHLDSHHRNDEGHNESKFKVFMGGHPIKNVKRVAVKQFTCANTIFNVRKDNNTLNWYESYRDLNDLYQTALRTVTIPVGTYSTFTLIEAINNQIKANENSHIFGSENPLSIQFSLNPIDENYTVNVEVSWMKQEDETAFKQFAIGAIDFGVTANLWDAMGFTRNQQVSYVEKTAFMAGHVADNDVFHDVTEIPLKITGLHPSTFEAEMGVYLTSNTLTNGNTYETKRNQVTGVCNAVPVNVLEWVQFDQPRYSTVHYNAQMMHWHYLNQHTIHEFDIELRDSEGSLLDFDEINRFSIVLVFETVEIDEVPADFIKQYNKEGYDLAHAPERINWSKLRI